MMDWFVFFYFIDVKSVLNSLTDISQIIIAIAALFALDSWKSQLKGGGKYALAKNLLISARKLQVVIQNNVRNPGLHPSEIGGEYNRYNYEYLIYQKRLRDMYYYKRDNFDSYSIESEVLFDETIKNIIKKFDRKVDELRSAIIFGYGMFTGNENQDKELWKMANEKISKNRELLWNTGLQNDNYSQELDGLVKELEKTLSQFII